MANSQLLTAKHLQFGGADDGVLGRAARAVRVIGRVRVGVALVDGGAGALVRDDAQLDVGRGGVADVETGELEVVCVFPAESGPLSELTGLV